MSEAVLFAGGALAVILYFSSSDSNVVANEPEKDEVIVGGVGYGQPGYINPNAELPVSEEVPQIIAPNNPPMQDEDIGPAPVVPTPVDSPIIYDEPEPEPEPSIVWLPPPTGKCIFHPSVLSDRPEWAHESKEKCFKHSRSNTYQTSNGELYTYQGLYNPTPVPDPQEEELINYNPVPEPTGPVLGTCTLTPAPMLAGHYQTETHNNMEEGTCLASGAISFGSFKATWVPN